MLGKGNRAGKRKYVEAIKSKAALSQTRVERDARLDGLTRYHQWRAVI